MTEYKHARLQRHARTMLALSAALLILFTALIVAIKTVDVQNVGPNGSQIGLATLNLRVHQRTGLQMGWYDITDKLGKICILIAPCFALLGLYQLIRRRSLKRVDADLWALAGLYVALGAAYVLFEKVIINYRPVILPTETALEASFPSSHTMLAVCTGFLGAGAGGAAHRQSESAVPAGCAGRADDAGHVGGSSGFRRALADRRAGRRAAGRGPDGGLCRCCGAAGCGQSGQSGLTNERAGERRGMRAILPVSYAK